MQTIKRDIYVTKNVLQAPIEVTEGTNSIALEFDIKDNGVRCHGKSMNEPGGVKSKGG